MNKKIISVLLAAIMILSTFTVSAFANEADSDTASYIYCSANHAGQALITQKMADDSDGALEATKVYSGDAISFHLNTTNNLEIVYNPNGGFNVADRSTTPFTMYDSKNYTVLGMGATVSTSMGDSVLEFAHKDGNFLYWVVTDVQPTSSGNSYKVTFSAVWDITESTDDNEETTDFTTKFNNALTKIGDTIKALFLEPFYAILRLYNEKIREPLFELLDSLFGDLLP